jgi:hypothetical protein
LERNQRGRFTALASKRMLCVSLVSLLLAGISELNVYTLRVKEVPEGHELAAIHVSQGDLLQVEYMHSMYEVKQSEVFSIGRDSRFHLEKVTFGSYAAALYYDANPSQGVTFEGGLWMVKGGGKNFSALKYRVSPGTGHVLRIGNQSLDLFANSQSPGRLIEISMEREKEN